VAVDNSLHPLTFLWINGLAARLRTPAIWTEQEGAMLTDQRRGKRRVSGPDQPNLVLALPKPQTLIQKRLIDTAGLLAETTDEITYQHSILCQTSLPYRDPGPDVRRWSRQQGGALLEIDAGRAIHPELGEFVDVPLPYGPKARLILLHLNAEAIRTKSPRVDVGDSLTAFVQRIGVDPKGRNIRLIREQVTALSTALIRLGFVDGRRAQQLHAQIVEGFELWLPKDSRQRVLWPSYVDLNMRYFESLRVHAVPLDERAIGALSHSAMGLDVYAWLAQRLHRIPKPHRQLIPWPAIKDQFGGGYQSLRKFRQVFMTALRQVHAVYPSAKIDVTPRGLLLHTSPPPVAKTGVVVHLPA
jgi:hypothetical protein